MIFDADTIKRIGININFLRKSKGLTQENLAYLANVSPSTLRKKEEGEGKPQFRTIEKIAEALEVKPNQLASLQYAAANLYGETTGENVRQPTGNGHAREISPAGEAQSLLLAKDEMDELAALIARKFLMMNRREMMQGMTATALTGAGTTDVAQSIQYGLNGRKIGSEVAEWAREQVAHLKWLDVRVGGEQLYTVGRSNLTLLQTLLQMRAAIGEDELDLRLSLAETASQVGWFAEDAEMLDQATQYYHFGVEMARTAGSKDYAVYCMTRLAAVQLAKGKPLQCLSQLEAAETEAGCDSPWHSFIQIFAVEAQGLLGNAKDAQRTLAKADAYYDRGIADRMKEWAWSRTRPSSGSITARSFTSHDPRFAVRLFEDALAQVPVGFVRSRLHHLIGLARAKQNLGELDVAIERAVETLMILEAAPMPRVEKQLAKFHAKLPDDPIAADFKERYESYVRMRKPGKLLS